MNAQIIAVVNQKGGVEKCASCVNLGVGLVQAGKKVLLVDVDLSRSALPSAWATPTRHPARYPFKYH